MKNLFTFFALILAVIGSRAQEITLDTLYFQWDPTEAAFFEVFDQQFDNGDQNFKRSKIGDTTATIQYIFASIVNTNQSVGNTAAELIVNQPAVFARNALFATAYQSVSGTAWNVAIANAYAEQFVGSYQLVIDGANQGDFTLTQLGSGLLRLALTSNPATNYPVRVYSQNTLLLVNLPTLGTTPVFLVGKNRQGKEIYSDMNRKIRFVKLN